MTPPAGRISGQPVMAPSQNQIQQRKPNKITNLFREVWQRTTVDDIAESTLAVVWLSSFAYTMMHTDPHNPDSPDWQGGIAMARTATLVISFVAGGIHIWRQNRSATYQWLFFGAVAIVARMN